VVIRVPEPGSGPMRVLAVRDEDPQRAWRPFGAWWPDRPGIRGVMDELAGGAWLAADHSTLAVLLNRAGGAAEIEPGPIGCGESGFRRLDRHQPIHRSWPEGGLSD